MTSHVKTILFTDVQGFAQRTSGSSRDELMDFLANHDALLLPAVRQLDGEVIKTIGDALMVSFDSPTNAVLCGMLMQAQLREYNASHSDQPLQVRIAINSGEVEQRNGDLFGEAVTIAARIVDQTKPGEVYFTEAVYLSMNKVEAPTAKIGAMRLKGIEQEIRLFRLVQEESNDSYQHSLQRLKERLSARPTSNSTGVVHRRWLGSAIAVLLLVIIAIGIFWALPRDPINSRYLEDPRLVEARELLRNKKLEAAIERFGDFAEVRSAVLASWDGGRSSSESRPETIPSALLKAAMIELPTVSGDISSSLGWPLIAVLLSGRSDDGPAFELQQRLGANFAPARPWFEQQLLSDNPQRRRHALAFLKRNGWLTVKAELASQLHGLSVLAMGYRADLESALSFIETAAQRDDWAVLKRIVVLPELQSMVIWRRRQLPLSGLQERAGSVFLQAFPAQFRLRLQEALSQAVPDIYQPALKRLSEMAASTGHH